MYTLEEICQQYQRLSAQSFRDHRYWVFPVDRPSPFLLQHKEFSCGDTNISVIDHYHGRAPWLMNHEFACGNEINVQLIPTVIMDSHIVSYLRDFANENEHMPPTRRRAVLQLLEWLILKNWDYNPFYYWLEAGKKLGSKAYVQGATEAIFRLHNMDKDYFLRTGKVQIDHRKLAEYLEAHQVASISELATTATEGLPTSEIQQYMEAQANLSYTVILLTVLIQAKHPKYSVTNKMRLFHEFVVNKLRLSVAREIFAALLYFAEASGKFMPRLQSNSNPDEVMRRCQAAAWDLVLLRLPEALLVSGRDQPVPLAYVCTGERALQRIGRSWILMHIESTPPSPHVPKSAIIANPLELRSVFSDDAILQLDSLQASSYEKLQQARAEGAANIISKAELPILTAELEDQIRGLTSRRK